MHVVAPRHWFASFSAMDLQVTNQAEAWGEVAGAVWAGEVRRGWIVVVRSSHGGGGGGGGGKGRSGGGVSGIGAVDIAVNSGVMDMHVTE
ncbi:unnamed protein product [Schistocephalus solidus]|uniref:Uncharacterized protein n=1 Tax=Schistocephalus solidus TaxID=70667 RepID=A0A183T6C5_SCHSO|nr:unnamed protein product [Schistocephalus solidus]